MIQEYLIQWIMWYYGNGEYPSSFGDKLTYNEMIIAIEQTNKIKKILGESKSK